VRDNALFFVLFAQIPQKIRTKSVSSGDFCVLRTGMYRYVLRYRREDTIDVRCAVR
jgi:hypothetical protein